MPTVHLSWYYHLPHVASELEVAEHVERSLLPLLQVHVREQVPLLLTLTGSFLRLIQKYEPAALDVVRQGIATGLVELGGCCFYEVDPLHLPVRWLREHIRLDLALKEELFDVTPTVFHVPNFRWRAGMEQLLAFYDYRLVLLDCAHFEIAARVQTWHWGNQPDARSSFEKAVCVPEEHRDVFCVDGLPEGCRLAVVFRDRAAVEALTFGVTGVIHRDLSNDEIAASVQGTLAGPGRCIVLVDDGDRIVPQTIRRYQRMLELAAPQIESWQQLAVDRGSPSLVALPSADPLRLEPLLDDLDSRTYRRLLAELDDVLTPVTEQSELLPLHDVFYPFWRSAGRRQRYVTEAIALLRRSGRW